VIARIWLDAGGPLVFDVTEVFDTVDASAIHVRLESAGPDGYARIDFHRVRRCEPVAVAFLAKVIAARRGQILVLGMGLHDRRLLRYFGMPELQRRTGGETNTSHTSPSLGPPT
jgi:hypothetical protein